MQAKLNAKGLKTAILQIASNDPNTNLFTITLNATGATAVLPSSTTTGANGVDFDPAGAGIDIARATLNGSIDAKGEPRSVTFEYGLTTFYGSSISLPGSFSANGVVSVASHILF